MQSPGAGETHRLHAASMLTPSWTQEEVGDGPAQEGPPSSQTVVYQPKFACHSNVDLLQN